MGWAPPRSRMCGLAVGALRALCKAAARIVYESPLSKAPLWPRVLSLYHARGALRARGQGPQHATWNKYRVQEAIKASRSDVG